MNGQKKLEVRDSAHGEPRRTIDRLAEIVLVIGRTRATNTKDENCGKRADLSPEFFSSDSLVIEF